METKRILTYDFLEGERGRQVYLPEEVSFAKLSSLVLTLLAIKER